MKRFKRYLTVENIILLIIGAVAAYVFFASFGFRKAQSRLVPQVISMGTLVCCVAALVIRVVSTLREEQKKQKEEKQNTTQPITEATSKEASEEASEKAEKPVKQVNQWWTMAAAVAYVALLEPLGFVLSTLLVLIGLPRLLGFKKWFVIIPMALILSFGLFFLFERVFYVRLPLGPLTFLR